MKTKVRLSVVLATFNEEGNVGRCLEAIKDVADEIVVVDGKSIDNTVDIAKKFGAKIIKTTNKTMFHTNKQMAIEAATGDWILQLDADEVVDEELKRELRRILANLGGENGYWLKRKNCFLGRFLTKGGQYPDKVIRLFRRGAGHLPQKSVHEQMVIKGKVGELAGHLEHYNAPNFSRYIANANCYTSLTAASLKRSGVKLNWVNDWKYLAVKPTATFLSLYIRHRGYVDGFPGLVFALFSGLHWALAYMKLGDLYAGRD